MSYAAYIINTKVSHVEERWADKHISGVGEDAIFQKEFLGWFVGFDGSHELLYLGMERPLMWIGDTIKITIQKEVTNAKPTEAPIK